MTIIWCMVPNIWSNVDNLFFSFWTNCSPFTHLTILKIKILKKWKNSLRYQHFTQVTIIWSSLEIGRNNCFVTALSPSLIKDGNDNLFPQTHLHNTNAFFEDLTGKHYNNLTYKLFTFFFHFLHFLHTDLPMLHKPACFSTIIPPLSIYLECSPMQCVIKK